MQRHHDGTNDQLTDDDRAFIEEYQCGACHEWIDAAEYATEHNCFADWRE